MIITWNYGNINQYQHSVIGLGSIYNYSSLNAGTIKIIPWYLFFPTVTGFGE